VPKNEEVYLRAYANGTEARESLRIYFRFYNEQSLHENLNYATPDEVYFGELAASTRAAARGHDPKSLVTWISGNTEIAGRMWEKRQALLPSIGRVDFD
jgi:hypothetical protein